MSKRSALVLSGLLMAGGVGAQMPTPLGALAMAGCALALVRVGIPRADLLLLVIGGVGLAVGALAFREPVTLPRLAGIATCLAGLWLLSRG